MQTAHEIKKGMIAAIIQAKEDHIKAMALPPFTTIPTDIVRSLFGTDRRIKFIALHLLTTIV
jgi:hypothetical protein